MDCNTVTVIKWAMILVKLCLFFQAGAFQTKETLFMFMHKLTEGCSQFQCETLIENASVQSARSSKIKNFMKRRMK